MLKLLLLASAAMLGGEDEKKEEVKDRPIKLEAILQEYEELPFGADLKYRKKTLVLVGTVESTHVPQKVERHPSGGAKIVTQHNDALIKFMERSKHVPFKPTFPGVEPPPKKPAFFADAVFMGREQQKKIFAMKKNDIVVFRGTVVGAQGGNSSDMKPIRYLLIEPCTLIDQTRPSPPAPPRLSPSESPP
jgi:hypothetical protein